MWGVLEFSDKVLTKLSILIEATTHLFIGRRLRNSDGYKFHLCDSHEVH